MSTGKRQVFVFSVVCIAVAWSKREVYRDATERNAAILKHLRSAKPLSADVRRRLWRMMAGLNTEFGEQVKSVDEIKKLAEQASVEAQRDVERDLGRAVMPSPKVGAKEGDHLNINHNVRKRVWNFGLLHRRNTLLQTTPTSKTGNDEFSTDMKDVESASSIETGGTSEESATSYIADITPKDLCLSREKIQSLVPDSDVAADRNDELLRTILLARDVESKDKYTQGQHTIAFTILEIETDLVWAFALYSYIMKDMQYVYASLLAHDPHSHVFFAQKYFQMLTTIVSKRDRSFWNKLDHSNQKGQVLLNNWFTLFCIKSENRESRHMMIDQFIAFGFQFVIQSTAHFYVKYKSILLDTKTEDNNERTLNFKLKIQEIMNSSEETAKHVRETHKKWSKPTFVMDIWYMLAKLHLRP